MNDVAVAIIFIAFILIVTIVYSLYLGKKYTIDKVTGDFLPKTTIAELNKKRQAGDKEQLLADARAQIDACLNTIAEACPEFQQKLGKTRDIIYHVARMKMLVKTYEDLPDSEDLLKSQDNFRIQVYEKVFKDVQEIVSQYLTGKKELDQKHKHVALRIELGKYMAHLETIKKLTSPSNQAL